MKKIFYLFSIIIFLFSCDGDEKNSDRLNTINVYQNRIDNISLHDIISEVKYVALDDSFPALIDYLSDIKFTDSLIYIRNISNIVKSKVLCFNRNGEFLRSVFENGNSASEIINMSDFDVTDNFVMVYDNDRKRMLYFSHDGDFIEYKNIPFYMGGFAVISDDIMAVAVTPSNPFFIYSDNYRVATVDKDFNLIDRAVNYDSDAEKITLSQIPFFNNGNFAVPYENVLYSIDKTGKIDSLYRFSLGEKELPLSEVNKARSDPNYMISIECLKLNKVGARACPIASNDFITLTITDAQENDRGFMIYDKNNDLSCFIQGYKLDRYDLLELNCPVAYDSFTDSFVYYVRKTPATAFSGEKSSEFYKNISDEHKNILIGNPDESNYVLAFVKFNPVTQELLSKKYKSIIK